jgi:aromatic-L-amino-acid decarboxylase
MDLEEFRRAGCRLVEWIAGYLQDCERYPVLARTRPGEIRDALPSSAPETGEPMQVILDDLERILVPGLTHWNHPAFFGYFPISGTGPGILAEFVTAALNQQGMLWRTSPASTELEEVALGWLRRLLALPDCFEGVIYDGGSTSNLHGLMAARAAEIPELRTRGLVGRSDLAPLRIYCSEQAHSSIEKAAIVLGLGQNAICKVETDEAFRMNPDALGAHILEDRRASMRPMAVVATVGTTSTSSIDPVPAIADICEAERIWLHVDASYGGAAAILPEYSYVFDGVARADSVVMNPHKWLFTPLDLSAFYCRRMDVLRASLALTPDYLETRETGVRNLMDTGVQLARRFRALKLWAVLRYFGAEGLRNRIAEHIRLAKQLATWIETSNDFELLAPVPLSVVCFRARPRSLQLDTSALDALNAEILERVNGSGLAFLSHTRLKGHYALRLAICNIRTLEPHIMRTWSLLQECLAGLLGGTRS